MKFLHALLFHGNIVIPGRHVEIGQRYRMVRAAGMPSRVWEVTKVYLPWQGGYEHACLKSVDDLSETMTLATSVVADKKRFVREG